MRSSKLNGGVVSVGALVLTLLLTACNGPCVTTPLATLRQAGLRKIATGPTFNKDPNLESVSSIATYQAGTNAKGMGAPQALIAVSDRFYVMDLTTDAFHPVQRDAHCQSGFSLSADGQWLTCHTYAPGSTCTQAGCYGEVIEAYSLAFSSPTPQIIVAADPNVAYSGLSWSSDGRHLAVLARQQSGGCFIYLFLSTQPYGAASLTGQLQLANKTCGFSDISWSPDGSRLAFIDDLGPLPSGDSELLQVMILTPPNEAMTAGRTPFVGRASVTPLATTEPYPSTLTWRPDGKAVLFAAAISGSNDGYQFVEADVVSRNQRVLLSYHMQRAQPQAAAWLPDGRHFLFAIGVASDVDCAGTPSDVYLYTPAT